jgi:hypothetical protein
VHYRASIKKLADGDWYARCVAAPGGPAAVQAPSRHGALEGLRSEIRFRLELCPCSAVADDYVVLDVADETSSPPRNSR